MGMKVLRILFKNVKNIHSNVIKLDIALYFLWNIYLYICAYSDLNGFIFLKMVEI